MNFFKKNDVLELQDKIDTLMVEKSTLVSQMKDYEKTIAGFMNVKSSYDSEKMALTKKYESEVAQLKQMVEMEKQSVARKVNRELAKIGVNQFVAEEISPDNTLSSPDAITDKWLSMPESPEKHEFFQKYEKVISKSVKK